MDLLSMEQGKKLGDGKQDAQNGDILILEENHAISHKKSLIEMSTKFEDETTVQGLDLLSKNVTTSSLHYDICGKSSDKVVVMPKLKHARGSSFDENDLGRQFPSSLPDSSPRVSAMSRSPNHARTPTRVTRKGTLPLPASPFWERKVSTSGNQGVTSSTPGRHQQRAIICGEASPDNSPTVPKFGDWDESNPSASEGFTQVFDQVRELRQNGGGTRTTSTNGPSSQSRQKTFRSSEGCCCFHWLKR